MATRIKSKSKIGRRIAKRAKAGKGVELGLGPGAASLVGKSAATKLAALAKRISAAKKAKVKAKAKKKMIKVSVKGPISSTITDAGTKAAVAARKAKRAKAKSPMGQRTRKEVIADSKAMDKSEAKLKSLAEGRRRTERADLVRRSNAQADRLAGIKPGRQPTTGMPARQSSGSGFNPRAAAEARKTPAKRALEARRRAQKNR